MVANAVTFAFRGIHLNRYHAAHGEVEVVLGLPENERPGIASLEQLFLKGNSGEPVPLGSVATIDIGRIPQGIHRTDRSTTTHISVEFDKEEYTTAQAQEIVTDSLAGLTLPDGYSWDWGQFGRRQDDSLQTMVRGVTLSLIVVLLLMAALFESLTQPLAIIITLPLAFFGAFWALWLFGYSLDIVAFIGIIILIGTVVNNGIVMVDHVNGLRSRGVRRVDALVEGCGDRLRPVVMTAITTIFGLIPLARSGATVAGVYVDGIAVAMIGGLTTSTIFTLLALPVWYTYIEDVGAIALRLLFGNRREPLPAETEPAGS
jgi:HAE1 family hydrophobic/amphiphilic exporter-1